MPPILYGLFVVYATLVVLPTDAITIEELPPGKRLVLLVILTGRVDKCYCAGRTGE